MKIARRCGLAALLFTSLIIAGCGGGGDSGSGVAPQSDSNRAPVANAGSDRIAVVGTQVTLDGSASTDPDGDALSYNWSIRSRPAGSLAVLQNANTASPSLTPDLPGSYQLNLVVSDGRLPSAPASMIIAATDQNLPPVANAGTARSVVVGSPVTLDGSASTDANSDQIRYAWRVISQPAGSAVLLSDPASVAPTFTPLVIGNYLLGLTVNDGIATSSESTVSISAQAGNAAPEANAGTGQSVLVGNLVTLDGSASSDANGDLITYAWSLVTQPSGSFATLSGASTVRPSFTPQIAGTYVAALVVSDGQASSQTSLVTISASVANVPPVANAGIDRGVVVGTLVILDGSASSDGNGDPLTYSWRVVSQPEGSAISLTGASSVAPSLTPAIAGTYVLGLTVDDGRLSSSEDSVVITASAANLAPQANAGPDQNVLVGSLVSLDGSASSDPNGDTITYAWSFSSRPAGSTAVLSGSSSAQPGFTPDLAGSYVIGLVVSDGRLDSPTSVVTVTASVANVAPVANAGPAQSVVVGNPVTLSGSASTDANSDALTYAWRIVSQPGGSSITLAGASTVAPTFTPEIAGTYVFGLIVRDGQADSTESTVTVTATVANAAPVANAGPAQAVVVGDTVSLDGSASTDANSDPLSYAWSFVSRPAGSTASLTAPTSIRPGFTPDLAGTYVIGLVVSDGQLGSPQSTVTITASDPNNPPTAVITGPVRNPRVDETVTLDASASSDPQAGTVLSYNWSLTVPAGSATALSSATAVSPSFVPDLPGSYIARLTVSDGSLSSTQASLNITVVPVPTESLVISTPSFADGALIPSDFRCVDAGEPFARLPALSWQNLPWGTSALLVLAERVGAGPQDLSLLHLVHVPESSTYFEAGIPRILATEQPGQFPFVTSSASHYEASDSPPCDLGITVGWTLYALTEPVASIPALQSILNAVTAAQLAGDFTVLHTTNAEGDPVPRLTRAGFETDFAEFIASQASFTGRTPAE